MIKVNEVKSGKRKTYITMVCTLAIVLFIINAVLTMLVQRYPFLSFDITNTKIFELSPQTIKNIQALKKDITIYVLAKEETFADTSTYNAQANEIIRQYQKNSKNIYLKYVDYIKDPTFAASFPALVMKHGDILVSSGEKHSLVPTEELFNYVVNQSGNLSIASSKAEEALYAAILNVTSDRTIRAALVTGHAEYTMDDFTELLKKNNYETESQNLLTGSINSETDMIIIVSPKYDYTEEELQKLDDFMVNNGQYGKTIFYCADAEQPELPAIATFLREWGVIVEDGAVFETDETRVYNYHPFYAVADYSETLYSAGVKNINKPMLAPVSRPLRKSFDYRNNYSTQTLLSFAASSGVRPANAPNNFTAADAVRHGPIPALVLCKYAILDRQSGKTDRASYFVVSGSAGMLDSYSINNPSFSNAEYLVGLFNSLSGRESLPPFKSKSFTSNALNLSRSNSNFLGLVVILIIPGLILALGIIVWLRRIHS